mmetsp:Transcript_18768/g.52260  ORF Transcript_18768/g.52260 Transcript_18768/m.52260 type:complete len:414 (-) Transcript_18768:44-1285(-)
MNQESMTVAEIREELRARGLKVSGLKLELIERLNKAIADGVPKITPRTPRGRATHLKTSAAAAAASSLISSARKKPTEVSPEPKESVALAKAEEEEEAAKEEVRDNDDAMRAAMQGWGEPCPLEEVIKAEPPGYRPPQNLSGGSSLKALLMALAVALVALLLGAWAVNGLRVGPPAATSSRRVGCSRAVDRAVWGEVLPGGEAWTEWLDHLEYVLAQHPQRAAKALTVLLAGAAEADCLRASKALQGGFPNCLGKHCLLHLKASKFSDSKEDAAGRLQAKLVAFLQECPQGVVILDGLQHLDPRALPVLFSALSEHGQFLYNGKPVPSSGAVFVFTMAMELGSEAQAPEEMDQHVKEGMVQLLLAAPNSRQPCKVSPAEPAECEKRHTLLRALRRRFDMVAAIAADAQQPQTS